MRRFAVGLILAVACAALLLSGRHASLARGEDGEASTSPEEALLTEAEELASRGRYSAAARAYRKLAKEFPDTEAGRTGARRSQACAYLGCAPMLEHGPSANRIDVAVMGDGYRLKDQKKFDRTAAAVPKVFERHRILGEYFTYHNFHRVNLVSADSHVDANGRSFDTILDGHQSGALQGQVAVDEDKAKALLDHLPAHDGLVVVFVQHGTLGRGGGGVATVGGRADDTLIHEWGHAFARLGDEYSAETGRTTDVPELANVSAQDDPERVPWAHWLKIRARGVGVYEGADSRVRGAYKPTNCCAMDTGMDFCLVCREAFVLRMYEIVDPIDGCTPAAHPLEGGAKEEALTGEGPHHFEVRVLEPAKHALRVAWWVLPEADAPERPEPVIRGFPPTDRCSRGPLRPIAAEAAATSKRPKRGVFAFDVDPAELAPGRYRVICRVHDPVLGTKPGKWTWVVKDVHGLLESERAWWIVVD